MVTVIWQYNCDSPAQMPEVTKQARMRTNVFVLEGFLFWLKPDKDHHISSSSMIGEWMSKKASTSDNL